MPHPAAVIGIDVGTTNVKGILLGEEGATLGFAQEEYPTYYPHRGWAEQEPDDWWQAVCSVTRRLMAEYGARRRIAAIGISSQAPSYVPVDREGRPVGRAIIWMDRRSDAQVARLREQIGEARISALCGNRIDAFYTLPKLLWHQANMPDSFRQAHKVLQVNGYVNYRLTGAFTIDAAHAGLTLMCDMQTHEWDAGLLERCGIDPALLPGVSGCMDVIGRVTPEAAACTGLPPGVPVIAGTVDGAAAALESGVVSPGIGCEMNGTSSVLIVCPDRPSATSELIRMNHAMPGRTLLLGAMSSTGASLRWLRDQYAAAGPVDYGWMNAEAERGKAYNDLLFLPYMMGERSPVWDSHARGVFTGLSLNTSRGDMIRAVMEGCAFALRDNVEHAERAGAAIRSMRLVGGASQSALWNQIKADILGKPLHIYAGTGGAPLADAALAGTAVGLFRDAAEVTGQAMKLTHTVTPNGERASFYDGKYALYKQLYPLLQTTFAGMTNLMEGLA
ncbi:MAG: xylB [Paenibacillus sp.]|nr:xylB [Paenibacillus sp.]